MPTLVAGAVAVIVLYLLLQMFRAANPVVLARAIKIGGGVLALAVAAFTGLKGELAVAVPLGIFGAGLLGWAPFGTTAFGNFGGLFGGAGGHPAIAEARSDAAECCLAVGGGGQSPHLRPDRGGMRREHDRHTPHRENSVSEEIQES